MKDTYNTITAPTTGLFKDKGSKFLAYGFSVATETEIKAHLQTILKLHPKARHHCYAYRLGLDGNNFRANDAGEPTGTAGKPILGQIDSFGLTNALVIVVRYFGGTKLGVGGLINAYRQAAMDALEKATVIEKKVKNWYELTFGYAIMSQVMNFIKRQELEIIAQDFGDTGKMTIALRKSEAQQTLDALKHQLKLKNSLPYLKIQFLKTV